MLPLSAQLEDKAFRRWWKGSDALLIHEWMQLKDKDIADKICLAYQDTCLTYRQLADRTDELARRLATVINLGDRVLLQKKDPIAQLLYFFAIIKAGGSCILIDAAASKDVCQDLIERHQVACSIDEQYELPIQSADTLPLIKADDLFLGALSSGSTGIPKLIWRSHTSWTNSFDVQSNIFQVTKADTLFIVGSLIYTANLNACVHFLALGGSVVIGSGTRPRSWMREIETHQVSALCMVPAHYNMLLKTTHESAARVHSLVAAGAKLTADTINGLKTRFPLAAIIAYYGSSELGHVAYITGDELLKKPGAAGKLFPDVKILFKDDEIWVRSPYLAPAYRPEGTAGDLGRLDDDGLLYVLGRKNGLINSGGVKVIPEQVEAILCQCPGVEQAAVGGVADANKGQRVCAWVVKSQASLAAADVLAFCRQKLRPHAWPQKVVFVETLPLNASGKIDRLQLLAGG